MEEETLALFERKGGLKTMMLSGMMITENASLIGVKSSVNLMAIKSFLLLVSLILARKEVNSANTSATTAKTT